MLKGTICERQQQNMMTLNPDDCRLSVSNLKLGCEHLKSCCPVAKLCEQWIAEKTITKALKQKHIEINRKTMECRTSIRQKMSSSGDIIM
ncbi:unnamed protein product [Anisakis simplex]|uniref:Cysteine-rich CWC family protein n=1 Tax=Anisakis simplex TaxID=6269 RepID=A0A0M3JAL8_ANISI|nr:unnamed protein product [Anisakis simplex]